MTTLGKQNIKRTININTKWIVPSTTAWHCYLQSHPQPTSNNNHITCNFYPSFCNVTSRESRDHVHPLNFPHLWIDDGHFWTPSPLVYRTYWSSDFFIGTEEKLWFWERKDTVRFTNTVVVDCPKCLGFSIADRRTIWKNVTLSSPNLLSCAF